MLVQAAWASRRARRLPAGEGDIEGTVGTGDDAPMSILFVGESPVAGVGCEQMSQSVAAATARELARLARRRVHWHAAGVNGIRIQHTIEWLLPKLPLRHYDFVVAVHGVNDTTGLTTLSEWRSRLQRLAVLLGQSHRGKVFFTQVAPMHLFMALPQPLRAVIGLRAKCLDQALLEHPAHGESFHVLTADFPLDPSMLAEDGYHPSAEGHAHWGRAIARQLHLAYPLRTELQ